MNVVQPKLPKHFYLVILFMVPLTGMGIDLYAPSLPWIVGALHTTPSMVKLTIPMYLVGYAIGPTIFGAISDSFGRKITVYIGMAMYIFSCLFIIFIPNIWVMLAMRIFQGAGAGTLSLTFRSLVSDTLTPGPQMHKFSSMMAITWSVGPIVAPFIGGYLQSFFGWQANFIFFIVYAIIILLMMFTIPETIKLRHPFALKTTLNHYKIIVREPVFWGGILLMGIGYSSIVFFNVVGPFLIQAVLHYTPIDFGHIALIMGFGFFVGGIVNRKLLKSYSITKITPYALFFMMVFAVVMLLLGVFTSLNIWTYCVSSFLIFFAMACIFPVGMSRCMGLFPKMSGSANALTVFMFSGFTAIMAIMASFLKSSTMLPVAIVYVILGFVCVAAYYGLMQRGSKAEE